MWDCPGLAGNSTPCPCPVVMGTPHSNTCYIPPEHVKSSLLLKFFYISIPPPRGCGGGSGTGWAVVLGLEALIDSQLEFPQGKALPVDPFTSEKL